MGVAAIIADDTVFRMNSDAVSISVDKRRGDDCAQRNVFEFSNPLKNIADLAGFNLELMLVINVLISATAAATKVGTRRLDSMRRFFAKIDNFGLGELFFLAGNVCRDQFAFDCKRNENGLAVFARDSLSAERDVLDFKIDRAQALTVVVAVWATQRTLRLLALRLGRSEAATR